MNRHFGSTAGATRRYERELVASEFPSIKVYRRPITMYEAEKAKAGKFYYSGAGAWWNENKDKPGIYIPLLMVLALYFKR